MIFKEEYASWKHQEDETWTSFSLIREKNLCVPKGQFLLV